MSELWRLLEKWPVVRQLTDGDRLGLGAAVRSDRTDALHPRTEDADGVVQSVCPYCAVGCGQRVFVKDGRITQIEGDPDSPISRGRLCPKGSATKSLVTGPVPGDEGQVPPAPRHRLGGPPPRPGHGHDRRPGHRHPPGHVAGPWHETEGDHGRPVRRTMGIGSLGGATLDNEENYLIKKLATALGAVQIENQARI